MSGTADVLLLARVSGSLVVVLMVAVLAARLARRAGARGHTATLQVRERIGLTREASAVVLEVDGRLLLLGVSAQQVSVLAELGGPELLVAEQPPVAFELPPAVPGLSAVPSSAPPVPMQRPAPAPAPVPLTRRAIREATLRRRPAVPPTQRGTGSALDPRTWQQGLEALRDLTARRG